MSSSVVDSPVADTVDQLIADEEQVFLRRQPRSTELIARGARAPRRRRHVQLADRRAAGRLDEPRRRVEGVRRRRHRVRRHARRLRRCPSPGTRTRRSSRRSATGYGAARTSRSRPRTRSGSPASSPRRFDLPLWRFANSGTEATMDAVHLARAITGRDLIIKVEGCYHGHHDSVQVSVLPEADEVGPRDRPTPVPGQLRHPRRDPRSRHRRAVQRPGAVARALAEHRGQVAGDDPRAGDDERGHHPARRRLPRRSSATCCTGDGALLIFDEVKTGFTTGPGRRSPRAAAWCPTWSAWPRRSAAASRWPRSAAPTTVMSAIADGRYEQVGTFNGNPLAMAATRATLTEVLTPQSYAHLDGLADPAAHVAGGHHRPARLRLARRDRRREGLRDLPPRPGPRIPRLPARSTPDSATCTG